MIANVDLIGQNQAKGEVANRLMEEGQLNLGLMRPYTYKNPKTGRIGVYATVYKGGPSKEQINNPTNYETIPLNTNATLRRDEWKQLDDAVKKISEKELIGIGDLRSRGLTFQLGNAFGTTQLEWHQMSDAMKAEVDMNAEARGQGDVPLFNANYTPIPIVYVDYSISKRVLEASRKLGNSLDTLSAERAARKINEQLEDMLFTDTTFTFGTKGDDNRNSIYSYVNYPDRNTVTLSTYGNWDDIANDSSGNMEKIINSVRACKQALKDVYHRGPYYLYVPGNYDTVLDADYDPTTPGTTVKERIMKIEGIEEIKVVDTLADDNVLMVSMTSDVVRLVEGFGLQNIEWMVNGGFTGKFKVLTIQVPQIMSDYNGRCGIVHMS